MEAKPFCELFSAIEEASGKQVKQWLESGLRAGSGLIRFDDVKVCGGGVICKPS
jgi:hypothetical protein